VIGINLQEMIVAATPDEYELAEPVEARQVLGHPIPGLSEASVAKKRPKRENPEARPPKRRD